MKQRFEYRPPSEYKPHGGTSTYYDPANLFSSDLRALAPSFASRRYSPSLESTGVSMGKNVAAARITGSNYSTEPYSAFSSGTTYRGNNNYSHGEPQVLLESLERMYKHDDPRFSAGNPYVNSQSIPLYDSRSANRTEQQEERIRALMNNANMHKSYMERTGGNGGRQVELLSELPFCSKYDSNCSDLFKNIAPQGSKGGHTTTGSANDYKTLIKNAVDRLKNPYQNYLQNQNKPSPSLANRDLMGSPVVQEYSGPETYDKLKYLVDAQNNQRDYEKGRGYFNTYPSSPAASYNTPPSPYGGPLSRYSPNTRTELQRIIDEFLPSSAYTSPVYANTLLSPSSVVSEYNASPTMSRDSRGRNFMGDLNNLRAFNASRADTSSAVPLFDLSKQIYPDANE